MKFVITFLIISYLAFGIGGSLSYSREEWQKMGTNRLKIIFFWPIFLAW